MPGTVDFDTDREDFPLLPFQPHSLNPADSIRIEQCEENVRKTHKIGPSVVLNTKTPHPADISLKGRVSLPCEIQEKPLDEVIDQLTPQEVVEVGVDQLPNLAWQCVEAGLNAEKRSNEKLKGFTEQARLIQNKMDKLLDLSSLQEKDEQLKDKLKTILADLRKEGLDLWPEANEIDTSKLSELKQIASSRTDKLRSDLQILFTTDIQNEIQTIQSIVESLREIIRSNSRLLSTIIGHYAK